MSNNSQHSRFVVMGFGLGGNSAHGIAADGGGFTSSWYLKPTELQAFIDNGHYAAAEMEGCILIDKVGAVAADPSLAFAAPMLGVKMQHGEMSRMRDYLQHDSARRVLAGIAEQNQMVGLLAAKSMTDDSFIGLDMVGPAAYAEWWRQHGAIIGVVRDGRVVWETKSKTEMPEVVAEVSGDD